MTTSPSRGGTDSIVSPLLYLSRGATKHGKGGSCRNSVDGRNSNLTTSNNMKYVPFSSFITPGNIEKTYENVMTNSARGSLIRPKRRRSSLYKSNCSLPTKRDSRRKCFGKNTSIKFIKEDSIKLKTESSTNPSTTKSVNGKAERRTKSGFYMLKGRSH